MKKKKGFLIEWTSYYSFRKIPIWIHSINTTEIIPVKFSYRGFKGYKNLIFSARLGEVEAVS